VTGARGAADPIGAGRTIAAAVRMSRVESGRKPSIIAHAAMDLAVVLVAGALVAGCTGGTPHGGPATPTGAPPSGAVTGACALVTQADLVAVTKGVVMLHFVGAPRQEYASDATTGSSSACTHALTSSWVDPGGITTVDGLVTVVLEADGAKIYFPITTGTPVAGLPDEAMNRGRVLFVRQGTAVLIIEVGIGNPTDDQAATQLAWAKLLAGTAVRRI
jgi:hypothetical protein